MSSSAMKWCAPATTPRSRTLRWISTPVCTLFMNIIYQALLATTFPTMMLHGKATTKHRPRQQFHRKMQTKSLIHRCSKTKKMLMETGGNPNVYAQELYHSP